MASANLRTSGKRGVDDAHHPAQRSQRLARSEEGLSCGRRMEEASCCGCARADARACMRSGPKEGRVRNRS